MEYRHKIYEIVVSVYDRSRTHYTNLIIGTLDHMRVTYDSLQ